MTHDLSPLERETVRRMRAEVQLAEAQSENATLRLQLAKLQLRNGLQALASSRGLSGEITVDFERGTLHAEHEAQEAS